MISLEELFLVWEWSLKKPRLLQHFAFKKDYLLAVRNFSKS